MNRRHFLLSAVSALALIVGVPELKAQVGNLFSGASQGPQTFLGDPNAFFSAIDVSGGIEASRAWGMLPAFVHVSASQILATGEVRDGNGSVVTTAEIRPFERLEYWWDFGDPGGIEIFTDPTTGKLVSGNTQQYGPLAVYCYRAVGTYTITLHIRGQKIGGGYITASASMQYTAVPFVSTASFTASISTTTLTVTAMGVGSPPIFAGMRPDDGNGGGAGNVAFLNVIRQQLSGTPGGIGTYQLTTSNTVTSRAMTASNAYYYDSRASGSDSNSGMTSTTPRKTLFGAIGGRPVDSVGSITSGNVALFFANGSTYTAPSNNALLGPFNGGQPIRIAGYNNPSAPDSAKPILQATVNTGSHGVISYSSLQSHIDHVYSGLSIELAATIKVSGLVFNVLRQQNGQVNSATIARNATITNGSTTLNFIDTDWLVGHLQSLSTNTLVDAAGLVKSNPPTVVNSGSLPNWTLSQAQTNTVTGTVVAVPAGTKARVFTGAVSGSTLTVTPPPGWPNLTGAGTFAANQQISDLTGLIAPYTVVLAGGADPTWTIGVNMPVIWAADNGSGKVRLTVPDTAGIVSGGSYTMANIPGTVEANTTTTVTVVDGTHVDLLLINFVNNFGGGYGTLSGTTAQSVSAELMWTGTLGTVVSDIYLDHCDCINRSIPANGAPISNVVISGAVLRAYVDTTNINNAGTYLVIGVTGTTTANGLWTVTTGSDVNGTYVEFGSSTGFSAYTGGGTVFAGGSGVAFNMSGPSNCDNDYMAKNCGVYGGTISCPTFNSGPGINLGTFRFFSQLGVDITVMGGGSTPGGNFASTMIHLINPETCGNNYLSRWVKVRPPAGQTNSGVNFALNLRANNRYDGSPFGRYAQFGALITSCSFNYCNNGIGLANEHNLDPSTTTWGSWNGAIVENCDLGYVTQYSFYLTAALNCTFRDNRVWQISAGVSPDAGDVAMCLYRNKFFRNSSQSVYGSSGANILDAAVFAFAPPPSVTKCQEGTDNVIYDARSDAVIWQVSFSDNNGATVQSFWARNQYYAPNVPSAPLGAYMKDNSTNKTLAQWTGIGGVNAVNETCMNPNWSNPSTGDFTSTGATSC